MWVQSSVWLFTMKECNKTPLIRSPSNFTIRRAMKLDLESYFDVSKLDVWLDVLEFWFEVEGHWPDLKLNWRKISTLIWRSRNEPWFWESKGALLDLEITLYFGRVSVEFFSLSFSPFSSYVKPLFIGNSIIFNLEFSLSIYWELNYEFNLVFHLIRTFYIGLFFLRCHISFFIWCCHVAWFHSLIVHVIN